jgi:hypothetical protein
MSIPPSNDPPPLSPRRAQLASFEHAYAVAVQLRERSGIDQFVIRTGNPEQPVRITTECPTDGAHLLAMVA